MRTYFTYNLFFPGEANPAKVSTPPCAPSETVPVASESGDANSAEVEQASIKLEEDPPLR